MGQKARRAVWRLVLRFRREMKRVWTRIVEIKVERHSLILDIFWM